MFMTIARVARFAPILQVMAYRCGPTPEYIRRSEPGGVTGSPRASQPISTAKFYTRRVDAAHARSRCRDEGWPVGFPS